MFRFENPIYLYALIIVPIMAIIYFYSNWKRGKRLRKYGDPVVLAHLMPDVSRFRPAVKFWILEAALALLIVTLARPQFGTRIDTSKREGIETIIALDISNSMLAEDVKPSRLESSKMLISKLVDEFKDDKIGLVIFAGEAFTQLPITSDYVSAKMFLDGINPSLIQLQGTDIGGAINLAMHSFTQQKGVGKAIIVITDGEDNEAGAVEAAKQAAKQGYRVFVLGVGLPQGAPIPVLGTKDYKMDNEGNIVISKLNEQMCRDVAAAGNGAYIPVDNGGAALSQLQEKLDKLAKQEIESTIYSDYDEQFQAVAIIVLLLLIIEFCILEVKSPLFKKFKLFKK